MDLKLRAVGVRNGHLGSGRGRGSRGRRGRGAQGVARPIRLLLATLLSLSLVPLMTLPSSAVTGQIATLTFDNNTISQYNLAYQQALQPHGAKGTFFVNSGTIGASANFMSWAQLGTLAAGGNDIGGKTVNATNLTTDPDPIGQVCNDRAAIIQHGLSPVAFAYPGGAFNATVEGIVKNCGYGSGRTAGSLSPTGPRYAETLPPADYFATRVYAPSAVSLANMEALITGSSTHGGGWSQIVIAKICSQALDPANYATCSASSGHIELGDLNAFLDWVHNAGQPGGAPSGTTLQTVRDVMLANDAIAPTTTASCNGAVCTTDPYSGPVTVAFSAVDTGSAVASTHYTTDGSDPTLASPTYSGSFVVNASATVKYRSWDNAGNVEATKSQAVTITTPDTTPPSTSIACNGAACSGSYTATVTISFAVTDTGGSGADKTYYTTDGSTPTLSSPVYTAPFSLTQVGTNTVKFFSTDKAGNAEQVQSQQVTVAPLATAVSLTFDDNTISQYTLGYQQALQPHNAAATFFVNSGIVGSSSRFMSWDQLGTLAAAGNDIGGKTVHGVNLKTTTDPQTRIDEVCNDRQALFQHGLSPVGFAYPFGAFDASVESVVSGCGYGNARSAGSLSPTGPTYAETLPPKTWLATRAYAPSGQVTLANMEALVSGAASHGGGWDQIFIGKVCSQSQDPADYTTCTASAGWIELADLNSFLDWMGNAGQPGGAPGGAVLQTVRSAVSSADTTAPTTTISCDGAPCTTDPYLRVVRATFSATDVGSSVASTHYTTDGSDPTLSSPAYSTPVPITSPTTIKFRSWDFAGNAEATQSQLIQATPPPDSTPPTTTILCNNAACGTVGYNGSVTITFTGNDGPGWGVDKTYYTTDGSTPDQTSSVYSAPFQLQTGTYTVKFFSTDLAGNAEQVVSQDVQVLPPSVVVSLTFDDGDLSQYDLAFQRGLQPHDMQGTFFINTGNIKYPGFVTWNDLAALSANGQDVGGHTVDHIDLTSSSYTQQQKIDEVCNDRQALIDHGLDPVSFAYPFGAYDTNAQGIVRDCGYSSARRTGGLPASGPPFAETIPPTDTFATLTWTAPTPPTSPIQLTDMQAAVNNAAANGGGWVQFVIHDVCSQTFDPSNYASCLGSFRPTELDTFNGFLDWLQNAGQPGGAPARTTVESVNRVINGPDLQAPTTTLLCDGSSCQASTYNGSVTLSLFTSDPGGSGVQATYFTTDGSDPTTSSPMYTGPFTINQTEIVKFFSIDNAGNTEVTNSETVQVQPNPDPIIGAAGDIACDPTAPAFNGGLGTDTDCRAAHTATLMDGVDAVLPLGDDQYDCGGTAAFSQSYGPTWGVKKDITYPVPGDKDYATTGGTDCPSTPGAGYYTYFGSRAGDPSKGYYSYDLGSWHVVALNTAPCPGNPTTCAAGSAQDLWLQSDLAANSAQCTLAYWQNPRFASTPSGGDATYQQLWQDVYAGGVDVVLNGDSHWYERFQPMDASGNVDLSYGTREFIVGTGGAGLDVPAAQRSTSEVLDNTTHGVIKLTLHSGSYDWTFVHDSDGSLTDSGSANCHSAPPPPDQTAPTTTISCNSGTCSSGWYQTAVTVTLSATDAGGSGVASTHYTTDGTDPSLSSPTYTGPFSVFTTSTVKFRSWDNVGNVEATNSQLVQIDGSAPTTAITCNGAACSGGFYAGNVTVALSATDGTGGSGVASTLYTTDGTDPATSATAVTYSGPFTLQQSATVKFLSTDVAGNAEATKSQQVQIDNAGPVTTISCNSGTCSSGWYKSAVTVTLSATDAGGSGVASTHYTTDGTDPSLSSPTYTGPFSVFTTSTVKFRSWDTGGNVEATNSKLIQIDGTAPTTAITCNSAACSGGFYAGNVTVALSATDGTGGSGVASTLYTTDGTDPATSATALTYSGPFTLSQSATVKFLSTDVAGNVEATQSQSIEFDGVAPITSISCNSAACSGGWYKSAVTVTLSASDTGGSGVASTHYTTDGTDPSLSSPTYTSPFSVFTTTTVKFRSWDVAGNVEATNSQLIQIDGTAPITTITCNGAACGSGYYSANTTIALSATDTGGSGVASTRYTTDGTDPATSATAVTYSGPFTLSQTTTVKFLSTDVAGNSEATKTQQIQVDAIAPTASITCGGVTCLAWYRTTPIKIVLSATDTGGSGLNRIRYTTDGSDPVTSSTAITYTTSFNVSATTTVKFYATDLAGNASPTTTTVVGVDKTVPTTSMLCNGATCSSGWYQLTSVTVTLNATDTGGSGVAQTKYTTDGTDPKTSATAIVYTGPFAISKTTTVKFYSVDGAGNTGSTGTVTVQLDAAAPTVTMTAPANNSSFKVGTKVTLSATATDTGTGGGVASGVASVTFYLDGTTALATDNSSPYSFSWNTNKVSLGQHTLTAVAVDKAGNSTTSATITITITA